jgi:hypothetical protein
MYLRGLLIASRQRRLCDRSCKHLDRRLDRSVRQRQGQWRDGELVEQPNARLLVRDAAGEDRARVPQSQLQARIKILKAEVNDRAAQQS